MIKKNRKIVSILSLVMVFLIMLTISVQAVDVSKDTIKKNLESYAMTGKVASAVVGNSRYTVGGDAAGISSLAVTDDTISFISSNTPLIFKYKIEGNICTFTVQSDITSQTDTSEYLTETLKINLLSACFLSITDSYGIDSNDALYYYEERIEKTKLELNHEETDNRDYIGISKRYVEKVGKVDDTVFHQYTKTINNTDSNCKFETILEIKMDQIANIKVEKNAIQSPSTNTVQNQTTTVVENKMINNQITNEVVNQTSDEISNEAIMEATSKIEAGTENAGNMEQVTSKKEIGGTVLKVVVILIIIALFVVAIIKFEKKK